MVSLLLCLADPWPEARPCTDVGTGLCWVFHEESVLLVHLFTEEGNAVASFFPCLFSFSIKTLYFWGTSLVAQWLRIHLPMQGTQVWALVQEDPTCRGATKPVHHNCWACALEPVSHNYWARKPQLLEPKYLEPVLRNKRNHNNEKPAHYNEE